MSAVYIISKNGERLMPTVRFGHIRHLLKDGKAIVFSRLLYHVSGWTKVALLYPHG